MEWDPEERDAWVTDAQRWIGQIKGVLQSKIELDATGDIVGIHVVAGFDREPRHIVRDVESLLKARLGIDVYYKKIGVVQMLDNGEHEQSVATKPAEDPTSVPSPTPESSAHEPLKGVTFHPTVDEPVGAPPKPEEGSPSSLGQQPTPKLPPLSANVAATPAILVAEDIPPRILCAGVGVLVSEAQVRAEVQLRAGEIAVRGMYEGPNHPHSDVTFIAEATLEAVGSLLDADLLLHLHEITTTTLGGVAVVLAAVNIVEGRRSEILFGTCSAAHNRQQAVVFAVLDALNRRLSQYPLQEASEAD